MKWLVWHAQYSTTVEITSPYNRTPATEEVVDFVRIFVSKGGLRCWTRSVTFATDWTFDLRNVVDDQDLKE